MRYMMEAVVHGQRKGSANSAMQPLVMQQGIGGERFVRKPTVGHTTQEFQITLRERNRDPSIGFEGQTWDGAAVLRPDETPAGKQRILIAKRFPLHAQNGQERSDFAFHIEFPGEKTFFGGRKIGIEFCTKAVIEGSIRVFSNRAPGAQAVGRQTVAVVLVDGRDAREVLYTAS